MGTVFGDFKLEGLDVAQMDDLGGVTDEILAGKMEILAANEVSDSGEDIMGEDSEDEGSFSRMGTHNPVVPEFTAGARVVYLGQEGDEMRLGYVVAVHGDMKGGPPLYTAYMEVINYSHSHNPPCAPARTHGQIQAPREPPN
jgi:hypothetical protein